MRIRACCDGFKVKWSVGKKWQMLSLFLLILEVVQKSAGTAAPPKSYGFSSLVPDVLGFGRKDDATVDIPLDTLNVRCADWFEFLVILCRL